MGGRAEGAGWDKNLVLLLIGRANTNIGDAALYTFSATRMLHISLERKKHQVPGTIYAMFDERPFLFNYEQGQGVALSARARFLASNFKRRLISWRETSSGGARPMVPSVGRPLSGVKEATTTPTTRPSPRPGRTASSTVVSAASPVSGKLAEIACAIPILNSTLSPICRSFVCISTTRWDDDKECWSVGLADLRST